MHRMHLALAAALLTAGCGFIGGPLPPLANVPAPVKDLAAVERGSAIIVHFSVPQTTTENQPLKKPPSLDLRLGPASEHFNAEQWADHARKAPEPKISGGLATYEIPAAAEWFGKEVTIGVRVTGANGKTAGWSNYAIVPVVAPPEKPTGVSAEATAAGIRLTWSARGDRFRILRRSGTEKEYTAVATASQHEWTDAASEFGTPYTYLVQTLVNTSGAVEAESDLSDPVSITAKDTFPPAAPRGLAVTIAPSSIEMTWDQNTETDVAGYHVYRATGDGGFEKLAELNQVPAYSDHAVEHGKAYRYAITAVDQAGNESGRSAVAELAFP